VTSVNYYPLRGKPLKQIASIFSCAEELERWSLEALSELHQGVLEMGKEYCEAKLEEVEGEDRPTYHAAIRRFNRLLEYPPENKTNYLKRIYDIILAGEGLSPLHGFGFSNKFGDSLMGNSERESPVKGGKIC
jgi:hypothetical protein